MKLKNILLIFIILMSFINVTSALTNVTISSNNLTYADNSSTVVSNPSYILLKSIIITQNISGIQNTSFMMRTISFGSTAYGKIYKNGVPIGTEQSSTTSGGPFDTFTENITQSWNVGDTFELWGYRTTFAGYVQNFQMSYDIVTYPFQLLSPTNGSTITSPVTLIWREAPIDINYTYQVATDSGFLNILTTGIVSNPIGGNISINISLNPGTYYWHVKNSTGAYLPAFNFTIVTTPPVPGRFNISVWDEVNKSLPILNYTAQVQNSTTVLTKTSSTTGWVNFSPSEVSSGEYLIYVTPGTNYLNYYPRMVLATSPTNVTMYLPNSTNATINIVSFSLLDVNGKFPYDTSTITILRGGYVLDKSYFSSDGTHAVYLIQGLNYQIIIQNGNNIFSSNYIPSGSGTSTITINDMTVNMSNVYPFQYNITYNSEEVILNWNDVKGILNSLNFTVYKGVPEIVQCQLTTSVPMGQTICSIDNTVQYHVIFSANTTTGFINQSFYIDYSTGFIKNQTGVNPIDGSPMGIGFNMHYGSFTMPQWVYNWVSLLIVILLAGSFGARFANIGAIVVGIVLLILESVGWFVPVTTVDNTVIMGITGSLTFFAILYFLQHRDRGG